MKPARTARTGFLVLAAGNLAGKAAALAREMVFAGAFGTGDTASGFRVAQSLSFVPANLIASDVLSAAFAPSYARAVKREDGQAAGMLKSYSMLLGGLLIIVAVLFALVAGPVVQWTIPGASEGTRKAATGFLQILVWSVPLYGVSAVLSLALASNGRFASQSMRPLLQSMGLLAGTFLAVLTGSTAWLAVAFTIAWAVFTGVNLAACWRLGLFENASDWPLARSIPFLRLDGRRTAPLLVLPLLIQGSIILERTFASLGPAGLLASVDYARTISDSFMSLVAVPLGVLGLTRLSTLTDAQFNRAVVRIIDLILLVVVPLSMLIVILAGPLVVLLYQRGSFSARDSDLTSAVLGGHAVLLVAQVLGYVLSRALVARGRTVVVVIGTAAALAAQVLVQSLVTTQLGPFAIGFGPSIYGLVLTIWFAVALGKARHAIEGVAIQLPVIATTVVTVIAADTTQEKFLGALGVGLVWLLVLTLIPSRRRLAASELVVPMQQLVPRRQGSR